jgi:hypothetical protein
MAINKAKRFEVFHRDRFTCRYCGRRPPEAVLEVDHVIAVANGGGDETENLVTACFDCNRGKSATPLSEEPETVDERLSRRREALAQVEAYNALVVEERESRQRTVEKIGVYWCDHIFDQKGQHTFGDARAKTVATFLASLPLDQIYEAIDIAMDRCAPTRSTGYDGRTFKYFCGVCWNKIRANKEASNPQANEGDGYVWE